jgi:hypothetical protein
MSSCIVKQTGPVLLARCLTQAFDIVLTETLPQTQFVYDPHGAEAQKSTVWTEDIRDLPITESGP